MGNGQFSKLGSLLGSFSKSVVLCLKRNRKLSVHFQFYRGSYYPKNV